MPKQLIRFFNWYDALKEPWRFFVMLAIVAPFVLSLSTSNYWLKVAGIIYVCLLVLAFMIRDTFIKAVSVKKMEEKVVNIKANSIKTKDNPTLNTKKQTGHQ